MKCPFRTEVTKSFKLEDNPFDSSYGKVVTETTEFKDCMGGECPFYYFGVKIDMSSGTAIHKSVHKCRRAEI